MLLLAQANIRLFFKFLECQGYDLWLERVVPQSHLLKDNQNLDFFCKKVDFLTNIKVLIEKYVCKEKNLEEELRSSQIRVFSLMKGLKPDMSEDVIEESKEDDLSV